ncbi:hypothetical protein L198_04160 [Cryptococcus wingfieldii CBS 7118]|uniref:NADH dehydrogenase n=1 Tax=Cryptococcus wingfieldii CBS 7118 TaxID=1295528 RepID=A0A1E3J8N8_9TREE|nr:hypothetical protein L198_04160 [Cryptococcus wingfieldii CBS 7118]ODN96446.1 hypothetical protein L198_04160 [Cryptococcus wingfieldii CBS 7118]
MTIGILRQFHAANCAGHNLDEKQPCDDSTPPTNMAAIYRYTQRLAHESPVIFWSLLLGFAGPVAVLTVPPIRRSFGYQSPAPIPTSFPTPSRPRHIVKGYEDLQ